jgi:stringent starvation protein B
MSGVIPYLIRAYCDWIEDNKYTPYLLVNTSSLGVIIPEGLDAKGKMVLNISSSATEGRVISNKTISFKARFQGKPKKIVAPCHAVLSVYAKENGEGMVFDSKKQSQKKKTKNQVLKY